MIPFILPVRREYEKKIMQPKKLAFFHKCLRRLSAELNYGKRLIELEFRNIGYDFLKLFCLIDLSRMKRTNHFARIKI